jgi:hypothetical protein
VREVSEVSAGSLPLLLAAGGATLALSGIVASLYFKKSFFRHTMLGQPSDRRIDEVNP